MRRLRILILLGLLLTVSTPAADVAAPTVPGAQCLDDADREHLKALAIKALDDAFEIQIEHLFEVWMRDLAGQPARARNGVDRAIKAWRSAREMIERYQPPECPPEKGRPK